MAVARDRVEHGPERAEATARELAAAARFSGPATGGDDLALHEPGTATLGDPAGLAGDARLAGAPDGSGLGDYEVRALSGDPLLVGFVAEDLALSDAGSSDILTFSDPEEAFNYAIATWLDAQVALSPGQLHALFHYGDDKLPGSGGPPGYREINGYLRGQIPGSAEITASIGAIDEALRVQPVPEDLSVVRFTALDTFDRPVDELPGTVQRDPGYLSAELESGSAKGPGGSRPVLHLDVPEGTPAMHTMGVTRFRGRVELLLGRGLSYHVSRVERAEDRWHVFGRIIPEAPGDRPADQLAYGQALSDTDRGNPPSHGFVPENLEPADEVVSPSRAFFEHIEQTAYAMGIWAHAQVALSPGQRYALFQYGANKPAGAGGQPDYRDINGYLRGQLPGSAEITATVEAIDEALRIQPVPEDVTVLRMTGADAFDRPVERLPGTVQHDPGYLSTTLDEEDDLPPIEDQGGSRPVIHLAVPAGTPAMYMADLTQHISERELLLGRGLSYLVDRVENVQGRWHIYGQITLDHDLPGFGG
jgi:hypothetical protein